MRKYDVKLTEEAKVHHIIPQKMVVLEIKLI